MTCPRIDELQVVDIENILLNSYHDEINANFFYMLSITDY